MFDEIARSLKRQASILVPQIREAMEKARIEAEKREAEHQAWLRRRAIEEEERRKAAEAQARAQAVSDSKQELLGLIQKWDQAKRVREFLADLEGAVSAVAEPERGPLLERIRKAKNLLGEFDVLGSIQKWKTPEERYPKGK